MSAFPNDSLNGAVALITGARGGIGSAICAVMTAAGARVVATGLTERPEDIVANAWMEHDVTSEAAWARVVDETRNTYGRLDCLVNNAGVSYVASLADTSIQDWRKVMAVNVESVLLGLQACLPLLRKSGAERSGGASVVNVASLGGLHGVAHNAAYCASKGALTLLSKSAAKEFCALGYPIRVNTVHPGTVKTRMLSSIRARHVELGLAATMDELSTAYERRCPLGRMADPEEVAACVAFLSSSSASFMTGSALVVDGGFSA